MAVGEFRGRVMASELQLVAITDAAAPEPTCWTRAVELLDHLEQRWSRFLPDSDVTRLNLAHGRPVPVDPSTITLVTTMIDAWTATDHRFDPTVLPALMAAGYRSSIEDPRRVTILPTGDMIVDGIDNGIDPELAPTLDGIEIDVEAGTIRLPAGLVIDAGGIGKGLAADLAVAEMLDAGARGAMASIGGDISMGGQPPHGGWTINVEHPDPDRHGVGTISVNGGGVATSSTRSRRWRHEDLERHHVIDPWTGAPSTTDLWSATVVARSGWLAEAHATAALLAGSEHLLDHLDRHALTGLAVRDDGHVLTTDDLAELRTELRVASAYASTTGDPR